MDIQYALYKRTPKKRANRLSDLSPKKGVFLRALIKGEWNYADYFPHHNLGDRSCEVFLRDFYKQEDEYDQKVLYHLQNDAIYRNQAFREFKNHQLFSGIEKLEAQVIKYKLFNSTDTFFHDLLKQGKILRLDANGMFSKESFKAFVRDIPKDLISAIEYIEDPLKTHDWKDLEIPAAEDFIPGSPASFYIFKPNCEFLPGDRKKIIFSGYMGSNLGFFHAYSELIQKADLSLFHGVFVEDFFEEESPFLEGSYQETFKANSGKIQKIYDELSHYDWKPLCSI